MAEIMGAFAHDLDNFVAYYENLNWDTSSGARLTRRGSSWSSPRRRFS